MEDRIAKVDVYSWYDPTDASTLERLSPEKVRKVADIERACRGFEAHVSSHVNGGRH